MGTAVPIMFVGTALFPQIWRNRILFKILPGAAVSVCLFVWWAGFNSLTDSLPRLVYKEGRSKWGFKRPALTLFHAGAGGGA